MRKDGSQLLLLLFGPPSIIVAVMDAAAVIRARSPYFDSLGAE